VTVFPTPQMDQQLSQSPLQSAVLAVVQLCHSQEAGEVLD